MACKPTRSDMCDYLLSAISCLGILLTCIDAEECNQAVLAKRGTLYVPEGDSLSLSCVIQHCGNVWTGNWLWQNSTDKKLIINSDNRHHFTNVTLSANQTRLILHFLSANQSDEGSYGCKVTWGQNETDQGHLMYVNITAAVPNKRNLLHRILVCAGACLCLPVILGLARCMSSGVQLQPLPMTQSKCTAEYRGQLELAPKPPPRRPVPKKRNFPSYKAPLRSEQRAEVVYADISQVALGQQETTREPAHSTVYSSVRFS